MCAFADAHTSTQMASLLGSWQMSRILGVKVFIWILVGSLSLQTSQINKYDMNNEITLLGFIGLLQYYKYKLCFFKDQLNASSVLNYFQ